MEERVKFSNHPGKPVVNNRYRKFLFKAPDEKTYGEEPKGREIVTCKKDYMSCGRHSAFKAGRKYLVKRYYGNGLVELAAHHSTYLMNKYELAEYFIIPGGNKNGLACGC